MTELRLTQANVSGTDSDGSRDGRFLRELDAAYTDYQLVADCRPGVYPLNKAVSYHWFRFKLPLPKDELISIGDASLQLHWNPSIGNVNRDNSLAIKVHVVNFSGADAEIPEDASEAASYLSSSFSVVLEPGWLSLNPGSVDGHVYLSGFGEALQQATIDQASWTEDNHVLIILEPVDFNK